VVQDATGIPEALANKIKKLVKVYVESDLDEKEYKSRMSEYKREEEKIKQEISKLNNFIVSRKDNVDRIV
jgi:cell division protein FtsB